MVKNNIFAQVIIASKNTDYVSVKIRFSHLYLNEFFFAVCKRTCVSKSALDKHFLIHTQDKPFECIHCHKHFKQKSHVNYHVKMVHGTLPKDRPRNHICFHCGSAFTTASTLKKHVKTHTLGNFTNFSIQEKVDFTTFLSYLFSILCNFTNFSL